MNKGKGSWVKNMIISLGNIGILAFLFFVGSIVIHEPSGLRSQVGLIIPNDSVVYQGKVTNVSVTKGTDSVTFDGTGELTTYLLLNDQEVLTGASVQLEIPTLNLQSDLLELNEGKYSVDLTESLTITSQTAGVGVADVEQWQIQPLDYTFTLGDQIKNQKPNIDIYPIKISTLDAGLTTTINTLISQIPVTGYVSNANLTATSTPQEYIIPLNIHFQAKLLDELGVPLADQTLDISLDIPGQNYSEVVSITTDSNGVFTYNRQESAIIRVTGGLLTTLANPLSIEGASFIIAQVWWAPEGSGEGAPNRGNQQEGGGAGGNAVANDPINVATGNVYTSKQDLSYPSRGLPIQFTRFYNSHIDYQGPLGFGWTHSYNIYLNELANGNVQRRDGEGRLLTFIKDTDGTYSSPVGSYDTLTKNSDGTFMVREKHGTVYGFDSQGKLQTITDHNGNALQLLYTGSNLTTIVDTAGRQTQLTYDGSNRVISLTDPLGRLTTYGYDSNNDLISVTDPLNNQTAYEYNEHHCLKIITEPERQNIDGDPVQSHAYFNYDSEGRAKEFYYDENAFKITLEYETNRTTLTDSNGNQKIYDFQNINGHRIVTKM